MGTNAAGGGAARGVARWERGAVVVALMAGACNEDVGAPPNHDATGSTAATADEGTTETTADTTSSMSTGEPEGGWTTSLEVGPEVGAFFALWGPQPELLYTVAGQPLDGGLSQGALWRWDGSGFAAQALPADTPGLNWVFGVDDRRFLVGDLGVILVRDGDEGEWTRHSCGTILPLWGVWGAAIDDVWAVGGDGFTRDPIACHFDGEGWTLEMMSALSFESHALYKVWGSAAADVWAVGDEGLLMHWTGAAAGWQQVPSGADVDLISLWGIGPAEILAVGGRTQGVLARYDGAQWTAVPAPQLAGLNGVWMADDGTATVVGPQGRTGIVARGALEVQLDDSGTPLALHGIYGFSGIERWAVGGSLDMAPPYVGVVLHRTP